MSTREFRPRVVLRNSIHPNRAVTGLGFAVAATLVIAGCKKDESALANPEPPKAVAQPSAQRAASQLPPDPSAPPAPADVAAPPPDAQKTASGLVMKVVHPGSGIERVQPGQVFVITFAKWDRTGKPIIHIKNAELSMNSLSPAWAEAIVLMAPGETRRLWVPANLSQKPNVPNPAMTIDTTVDLTLEYIGRLKMNREGLPVMQASVPAQSNNVAPAGSSNGQPASSASPPRKKH